MNTMDWECVFCDDVASWPKITEQDLGWWSRERREDLGHIGWATVDELEGIGQAWIPKNLDQVVFQQQWVCRRSHHPRGFHREVDHKVDDCQKWDGYPRIWCDGSRDGDSWGSPWSWWTKSVGWWIPPLSTRLVRGDFPLGFPEADERTAVPTWRSACLERFPVVWERSWWWSSVWRSDIGMSVPWWDRKGCCFVLGRQRRPHCRSRPCVDEECPTICAMPQEASVGQCWWRTQRGPGCRVWDRHVREPDVERREGGTRLRWRSVVGKLLGWVWKIIPARILSIGLNGESTKEMMGRPLS